MPPFCLELAKALKSSMPVSRMGKRCEASTLVCAISSMRACWISTRSSIVGVAGAGGGVVVALCFFFFGFLLFLVARLLDIDALFNSRGGGGGARRGGLAR